MERAPKKERFVRDADGWDHLVVEAIPEGDDNYRDLMEQAPAEAAALIESVGGRTYEDLVQNLENLTMEEVLNAVASLELELKERPWTNEERHMAEAAALELTQLKKVVSDLRVGAAAYQAAMDRLDLSKSGSTISVSV